MEVNHERIFFYKYVSADVVKKILNNLQVKCSSPLLFNDPFDSQIELQHDVESSEELIERTTGEICEAMKPLLKGCTVKQAHSLVVEDILADPKFVNDRKVAFEQFYSDVNEKIFEFAKEDRIFCVSESNDNLLMWSHYADEHQGSVIQFKCIPEKETALCVAKPVIYSNKIPIWTPEDSFNKGGEELKEFVINRLLLTKSRDWEYEREWRVILPRQNLDKDYDLGVILEEEIEAVYLGCRMCNTDKEEIMGIVRAKRKKTKVYEAFRDRHEFKLDFKELK